MYLYDSKNEKKSSHISKDVWGHSENVETHTVETHIYRLRKKIVDKFNDNDFLVYNKLGYRIRWKKEILSLKIFYQKSLVKKK